MERTDHEQEEAAKLFGRLRAIVDRIAGDSGVDKTEIQVMLSHDWEAKQILARLRYLGYTDSEIERQTFR